MQERARRFRESARRQLGGQSGRGIRYPRELREEAVACAREVLGAGACMQEVAEALGVNGTTLCRWLEKSSGALRRVEIAAESAVAAELQPQGCLVLVTPQGYRVEGLELGGVMALLRALR